MSEQNRSKYQQGIIKRYYQNRELLAEQRLGELVSELYLTEGKKLEKLWKNAAQALANAGVPQSRIDHLLDQRKPELLAAMVEELTRQ